jgi:hypothetical protein
MRQGRRPIATAVMIVALATGLSPAADAWAGGDGDVQELKREVNRLRAEMVGLQNALAETTELERQRDVNLSRALRSDSPPPEPAAPPAAPAGGSEAASEAREPARPASSAGRDEKRRRKSQHRRHRRSGRWNVKHASSASSSR